MARSRTMMRLTRAARHLYSREWIHGNAGNTGGVVDTRIDERACDHLFYGWGPGKAESLAPHGACVRMENSHPIARALAHPVPPSRSLEVLTLADDETCYVRPSGDLDVGTLVEFERDVRAAEDYGSPHIVLDLSAIVFADSSAVSSIIRLHKRVTASGKRLSVISGEATRALIQTLGLADFLPVVDEVPDAVEGLFVGRRDTID